MRLSTTASDVEDSDMSSPKSASRLQVKAIEAWQFRNIKGLFILNCQSWVSFIVTLVLCGIGLLVVYSLGKPFQRTFRVDDATIGYDEKPNTISLLAVIFWPLLLFILILSMIELTLYRRIHFHINYALATCLHFVLCIVNMFIVCMLFTEIIKYMAGILRPDFLDRCQADFKGDCTNTNQFVMRDGRKSFPSGHASAAMCICLYSSAYLIWSLHLREKDIIHQYFWGRSQFVAEVVYALDTIFIMFPLFAAWMVGATRIQDNRHSTADVTGGLLLGAMVALLSFVRDVCAYNERVQANFHQILPGSGLPGDATSGSVVVGGVNIRGSGGANMFESSNGGQSSCHVGEEHFGDIESVIPAYRSNSSNGAELQSYGST